MNKSCGGVPLWFSPAFAKEMITHRHLLILLAALLMIACSKEEITSVSSEDASINFYVDADVITRAPSNFDTGKQFRVYAWDSDNTPIIYKLTGFDASNIVSYIESTYSWATTQRYYWPDDKTKAVTFYAFYPTDVDFDSDTKTIDYTTPNGGSTSMLYAKTTQTFNNSDMTTYHPVCINFRHPLCKVDFKAIITNPSLSVTIKSIELCNIKSRGTFSFPTGSTVEFSYDGENKIALTPSTSDSYGSWSEIKEPSSRSLKMVSPEVPLDMTTSQKLSSADGYLTLLPQTLTAWDRSANISSASGTYLKIGCELKMGTIDYSDNGYVYCPLGGDTWELGMSYTYTLSFGGGYDSDGKTILGPLSLSATINPWTDTDLPRTENETIYR